MPPKRKAKAAPKKADPQEDDVKPKKTKLEELAETVNGSSSQNKVNPKLFIPVDENCPLSHSYHVYIDNDIIYDASLNQTNSGNNNNKFYRIQLLVNPSGSDFKCWTRWGRVGENGQNATLGDGSLESAMDAFEKKFKDKSGHKYVERFNPPKPKKYVFVEKSYELDSDAEDGDVVHAGDIKKEEDDAKPGANEPIPECNLSPRVQALVEFIFSTKNFDYVMAEMNYDAKKLPLGKLSKRTLLQGYETLKALADIINGNDVSSFDQMGGLSDRYFSYIPHDFGRNRPPTIQNEQQLKKELELLESLSDMRIAEEILKDSKKGGGGNVHPLDIQFAGLKLEEMTPLSERTKEFKEIKSYLCNTVGSTHSYFNYTVEDIFRIEREGEFDRFNTSEYGKIKNSNRRLLWHGSRSTNFGGILSQGLRIAPPSAPVSGYMFGKGVYLADISSKSANYCCSGMTDNVGLLLLCEAELGDPMLELVHSDYNAGDNAKAANAIATHGLGQNVPGKWKDAGCVHKSLKGVQIPDTASAVTTNPKAAYLQYNEYIVYDINQVRLRYLLRVKMQ